MILLQPGGICPVACSLGDSGVGSLGGGGGGGGGFLTVFMMLVAVAASGAAYYFFKVKVVAKVTPTISTTVTPSATTGYDMRTKLAAQHNVPVSLVLPAANAA